MRPPRIGLAGRGMVRGLFAFIVMPSIVMVAACDKSATEPVQNSTATQSTATQTVADKVDTTAEVEAEPAEAPAPVPFAAPWTSVSPSWKELSTQIADQVAGKMSGEAWGTDAKVVAVARVACGSGTLLQTVFETGKGLRVAPPMPVSFFSLATQKPVVYQDGGFEITVNFTEDTPERLAGSLKITYEEHGKTKTFIDMEVDAKPLPWLLEPRLDGDVNVPEFQQCHPSGRFYAKAADGRTTSGYLYAGASPDARSVVLSALFVENAGLRIVVMTGEPLKERWTADLSKDATGAPVRLLVETFHTPELTAVTEAQGGNVGREKKAGVRRGAVEVGWKEQGKSPEVELTFTDLELSELIDGPLRGTTLTELRIVAKAYPSNQYPAPPPAELLGPESTE